MSLTTARSSASETYVNMKEFKPLPLPLTGYELHPGRQYYLDPVARCTIEDVYGLHGVPSIVECFLAQRDPTIVESQSTNVRTGEVRKSAPVVLDAQDATFRAFMAVGRVLKFTLDLAKIESLRSFYAESDKVSDYEKTDERPKAKSVKREIDLSILD